MKTFKHVSESEVKEYVVKFLMNKYGLTKEAARNIATFVERMGEKVHENV